MKEKNRLRKEMGREGLEGNERKRVVEEYRWWRNKVKKILRAKKKRNQETNKKLEKLRGSKEKEYWRYLKNLVGSEKKEESLPEEISKQDWNEAFSKLGKIEKKEFLKIKQEVENWEMRGKELSQNRRDERLDKDIEIVEVENALRKAGNGKAAGDDGCK